MLQVEGLEVAYAGALALRGISFHVEEGEIVAPDRRERSGQDDDAEGDLRPGSSPQRAHPVEGRGSLRSGASQGCYSLDKPLQGGEAAVRGYDAQGKPADGSLCLRSRQTVARNLERVLALFPEVGGRLGQLAGTLSGGEQQMVALMRALISDPKLLLLDEPSLGLSPIATKRILSVLPGLSKDGTSVLLVEQNAVQALALLQ